MISEMFRTKSLSSFRKPQFTVKIDWTGEGDYEDVSGLIEGIEIEEKTTSVLGGVNLAQLDLYLINSSDKFTPTE